MATERPRRRRSDHFIFKQFAIDQTGCAMRISSDATIFGAYVPIDKARRILDIGTGTGLLALMLAQRAPSGVTIDAVEINPTAYERAKANCEQSTYAAMIHVVNANILDYAYETPSRFDLIVSNPPYFHNGLLPQDDHAAMLARHAHTAGLDFVGLVTAIDRLLTADGFFWLILPTHESEIFDRHVKASGFHLRHHVSLRHTATSPVTRVIAAYGRQAGAPVSMELIRNEADNSPTAEIKELLRSYMLHY